ncbi:MAG: TfoX/Sxy family protein [Chitinophagales bacterium]
MAYNEKMTLRIREALGGIPNVEEKKMFRGVVFMVNDKMCITAGDNEMMCRIDPALHDGAVKKKGVRGVVMGGRNYKGYIRVHEDAMKSKKDFDYWISLALDFNMVAKASPKKKRRK